MYLQCVRRKVPRGQLPRRIGLPSVLPATPTIVLCLIGLRPVPAGRTEMEHTNLLRLIVRVSTLTAAAVAADALFPALAAAHSPHDVVSQIAVQHSATATPMMYALVRGIAVFSRDLGSTWTRISAGIWRMRLTDIAVTQSGALAVTDGHTVMVRPTEDDAWSPAYSSDEEGHVQLFSGAERLLAVSPAGRLAAIDGQPGPQHDVVTAFNPSGIYATTTHEVFDTDGVLLGKVVEGAEHLTMVGTESVSSIGAALYVGSEQMFVAESRVTSIASLGTTVIATLAADNCVLSLDGGRTWNEISDGLTTDPQADETHFAQPHFTSSTGFVHDGRPHLVIGGFDGLFLSDTGETWRETHTVLPRNLVSSIHVEQHDVLVTTYGGGRTLVSDGVERPTISPRSRRLFSTAADPRSNTTVITHAAGALRSTDGGRSWKNASLGPRSASNSASQRVKSLLKTTALEIGGRVGTKALDQLRDVYKHARSEKPQHLKLPTFGSHVVPPSSGHSDWYLVAKPSGVMRSVDGGQSFLPWLSLDPGETLAMCRVGNQHVVLTPASVMVADASDNWISRERPHGGPLDSIAPFGADVAIGTEHGLFLSSDLGASWTAVEGRDQLGVAALLGSPDGSLVVQYDSGEIERLLPDHSTTSIAAAGTPVMRHAVSFPDLSPMMAETDRGLVGSDHYGIHYFEPDGSRTIERTTMLHADRPELTLAGSWRITTDRGALGGVRATASSEATITLVCAQVELSLHGTPSEAHPTIHATADGQSAEVTVSPAGHLTIGMPPSTSVLTTVRLQVGAGFSFEGIELRPLR